jgi:hypothetical protein
MPVETGGSSSLPLPAGASTLAEQQTQTGHVDGLETLIAATNTKLDNLLAYSKPQSAAPTNVAPKTVPTGTAEVIAASTAATRYVRVTSDFANTVTVYIGRVGVTTANGQPLGPGDVYTNRDIDNANLLYAISGTAAQVLRIEVL